MVSLNKEGKERSERVRVTKRKHFYQIVIKENCYLGKIKFSRRNRKDEE